MIGWRRRLAGLLFLLTIAMAAQAAQMSVSQKDKEFDPDELTQRPGSSVRINNDDDVPHNVLLTDPDSNTKNYGLQKPGESVDLTFRDSGDYVVHCGIHPRMKLAIHVE